MFVSSVHILLLLIGHASTKFILSEVDRLSTGVSAVLTLKLQRHAYAQHKNVIRR